jgi:uncharacterized protein YggE
MRNLITQSLHFAGRFVSGTTFAVCISLFALGASADEERSVTASGTCRREIAPDRSSVTMTAEFRDKDAETASRKATEAFEKLRKRINELKIEKLELETTEFSVNEVREWEKDKAVLKGYQSRAGLKVSSADFGFSSKVIGYALQAGIKDIGGLQTFVSNGALDKARFDCLQEAVKDARAKAGKMAAAADASVGKVLALSESGGVEQPQPRPRMFMAKRAEMADASPMEGPTIEGGKTTVTVTVQASFSLR